MTARWNEIRPILNSLREGFPAAEAREVLTDPRLQGALAAELERLAADPGELFDGGMLHIVGMQLLAEKRDRRLAAPLLKLTSGSEDDVDTLWGDFLTDCWHQAAAAVCRADELKAFLENPAHSLWARAMATSALTIQVLEGDLERASTVEYAIGLCEKYQRQLDGEGEGDEGGDDSIGLLIDYLADVVGDLGEAEHLPYLERWFAEGHLDPMHSGIKRYRRELATPYEERRASALRGHDHYLRDSIEDLSGAYCYSPECHRRDDTGKFAGQTKPIWSGDDGTFVRADPKVGRNDPCPCGSGKKYKKCCGA